MLVDLASRSAEERIEMSDTLHREKKEVETYEANSSKSFTQVVVSPEEVEDCKVNAPQVIFR